MHKSILELKVYQIENFRTLVEGLKNLPENYNRFNMGLYFSDSIGSKSRIDIGDIKTVECGTAACVVGHGPSFGIFPPDYVDYNHHDWESYAEACFGESGTIYDWCFSGDWEERDNSISGAIKRIEWMLEHGVPKDHSNIECGEAFYPWETEEEFDLRIQQNR